MRLRSSREMETNIGILANSTESLWNYRNLLVDFEKETGYKLSMTLMRDRVTARRGMTFNPGGYDILILAEYMEQSVDGGFIKDLFLKKKDLIILHLGSVPGADKHIPGVEYVPDWEAMVQVLKERVSALRSEYQKGRELKGDKI